ncbi:MAG: DUF308 domain-containing protein [Ancrocorticia sp.]|jgi:uncharacterized membrane protein HdeD (DUF308 family)|nr:DUF308 domain-containing protein [Ancrocorticia sp.]
MSTSDDFGFDALALSADRMARSTIKLFRSFFAFTGVIAIALGIVLLVWPSRSLKVAAVLLSIYIIAVAIMRLITGITARDLPTGWRVLDLVIALLLLLGGVFMLRNTAAAAAALVIIVVFVVGFTWIFEGIIALIESGHSTSQGWTIAFGVLSIIAGVIVLLSPAWSAMFLIVFMGISLLVTGIFALVRAFTFGKDYLK